MTTATTSNHAPPPDTTAAQATQPETAQMKRGLQETNRDASAQGSSASSHTTAAQAQQHRSSASDTGGDARGEQGECNRHSSRVGSCPIEVYTATMCSKQ